MSLINITECRAQVPFISIFFCRIKTCHYVFVRRNYISLYVLLLFISATISMVACPDILWDKFYSWYAEDLQSVNSISTSASGRIRHESTPVTSSEMNQHSLIRTYVLLALEMLWFRCRYWFRNRNCISFQKLTIPVLVPVPVTAVVKESIPVGSSSSSGKKWNYNISSSAGCFGAAGQDVN